jgi:multidrug efflux system membrane fusion protein
VTSQGQTEILAGLNGTERVVLEGIDRLSDGQEVQIVQENPQAGLTPPAAG